MNSYEDELRLALKPDFESGGLREVGKAAKFFSLLSDAYPTRGSKIDWASVPGAIERHEGDRSLQIERFVEFFDEMSSTFELAGSVVYVGDSATDFALEGSMTMIRRMLRQLIEIPQHHYFIGAAYSWCICLTMEGDMGFGQSASPPLPR